MLITVTKNSCTCYFVIVIRAGIQLMNFRCSIFVNSDVSFIILLQTRTKDGYVLGLQRVTSHSVAVHKGAPPVLLIHGLFMVIARLASAAWFLVNI